MPSLADKQSPENPYKCGDLPQQRVLSEDTEPWRATAIYQVLGRMANADKDRDSRKGVKAA